MATNLMPARTDSVGSSVSPVLERVVQEYLAENLHLLGIKDLTLVDLEYRTNVGRIDILAQNDQEHLFVIELKRDVATREDVGQLISYIGDLHKDDPHKEIFGLLVADSMTEGAEAALHAVPYVSFFSFSLHFRFEPVLRKHEPGTGLMKPKPPETLRAPSANLPDKIQRSEKRYCVYCRDQVKADIWTSGAVKCGRCNNSI